MRIGRHMPTHSKMTEATEIARQIGCETIQIFASNPTGWRPPADDPDACAAFAEAARENDLDPVVLHAPYLINLGTPDDAIWEKAVALLTWTMQRASLLGARFVVFHTGSHRGSGVEAGMARVARGIEQVFNQLISSTNLEQSLASTNDSVSASGQDALPSVSLLLENGVGAGHSLGH